MTPASGAKEQVARLLALVPYLHRHGPLHVEAVAGDLGLSQEQVIRDLKVLFMCGRPGGYPGDLIDVDLDALTEEHGDRVVRVSNADYLDRPMRLSPVEATALVVALRALRGAAGDEVRPVVDRVLTKLEAALAEDAASVIDAGEATDPVEELRVRRIVDQAIADRRQLRLTYYVPSRDDESDRVVDPQQVLTHGGAVYLDAWCHLAEAPRLFRLDRIHHIEALASTVAQVVEPRNLTDGPFRPPVDAALVTLRLAPDAAWVPEYYPVDDLTTEPDGWLVVTLRVADAGWLRRLLLRLAPHAQVLGPHEAARDFRATVEATLHLYEAPDGQGSRAHDQG